jgi:tRNA threonylcarbamoyladenosine biosynthesis protein TsaB
MPLILNIETSSTICSVCLAKDGKLTDYRMDSEGNSHARVLTVFIEDLMKKNNLALADLDAVAVSAGPGSYTGLRIGASVAKGLCYALNKPLIAVPTLLSMAGEMLKSTGDLSAAYMPALDARRMDIYTAVYDASGKELLPTRAVTVNAEFATLIEHFESLYVAGSGAEKCKGVFQTNAIHFIDGISCDARFLIPLSEAKANNRQFEDVAYFEPYYLKEFGAKT